MVSMSNILIIGVTGSLGFDLAISSLRASHPTFGLVRDSAFCDPIKSLKLRILSDSGVTLLEGSLQDERSLLEAIKLVDVVICAIPSKQVLNQKLLVRAIKMADCVKKVEMPIELGFVGLELAFLHPPTSLAMIYPFVVLLSGVLLWDYLSPIDLIGKYPPFVVVGTGLAFRFLVTASD